MNVCPVCDRWCEPQDWATDRCVQCETECRCERCGQVVPRVDFVESRGLCFDCAREVDCEKAFAKRMAEEVEV